MKISALPVREDHMKSRQAKHKIGERSLDIEEVRLVSDLRIMHSKVDELYAIVSNLRQHYNEASINKYADHPRLAQDIDRVDEIYLWYIKLKEQLQKRA
jgi:hypothetical protein